MFSENAVSSLPQTPSVKAVNHSFRPFRVTDSQLWFIRLENYFLTNRINLQRYEFVHASTLLPDVVADNVREAIRRIKTCRD